jgi:hypothetical protein
MIKRYHIQIECLFLIIFLFGCKVDTEVWVNNNGGGRGTLLISDVPFILESEVREKLKQKDIKLISFNGKGPATYEAKIEWSDFNKSFGTRKVEDDSNIYLDFGNVDSGSVTVHITGDIDRNKTSGEFLNNNTVKFTSGRAELWYKPTATNQKDIIIILISIVALFGVFVIFMITKNSGNSKKPCAQIQESQIPQKEIVVESQDKYIPASSRACSSCGSKALPNAKFCIKCGKALIKTNVDK